MPPRHHRRAGRYRLAGRRRSEELAARLGRGLRERRRALGVTQAQLGLAAGTSQTWVSKAERGKGASGSLETWAAMSAAVGAQLVVYVEDAPGASRPRDYQHVIRQELVIRYAADGGWRADPERLVTGQGAWRYVDVLLRRPLTREVAVVEIWDFLDDVGAGLRGLADKIERVRVETSGTAVSGLLVVRATLRNRRLVSHLAAVFASHFPASSPLWLRALRDPSTSMPGERGLVWTDARGTRLQASKLPRVGLKHRKG